MASPTLSHSDDDEAYPTHHEQLYAMVELAQVCDFCTTFQTPLKLPPFSRTNLQAALIAGTQGDDYQVTLLAEVHYKLAREQTNVKIERMLQDWEKAVTRKVTDNWRLEFSSNPFDGATYADLSVAQRIQILNALCHWKLDSCADIHKHLAAIQKEGDAKAIETLRATPIGYDDAGAAYWYFDDECWIYAEDRPTWQADHDSDRLRSYAVEYADGKRIRLSVNFEPMDPTQVLTKVAKSLELKANGAADGEGNMDIKAVMVETSESPIEEIDDKYATDAKNSPLKAEVETKAEVKKMDINMLCGSPAESDGDAVKSVINLSIQEDVEMREEVKAEQPEASVTVEDSVATDLPNGTYKVKEEPNTSNDISNPHKKRQLVDDDKSEEEVEVTSKKEEEETHPAEGSSPKRKRVRIDDHLHRSDSPPPPPPPPPPAPPSDQNDGGEDGTKQADDQSEPAAEEPQDFDINCEACKRTYDRRYLDPPLDKRPHGEWRCFECLVNDARGWPRRRGSSSKKSPSGSDDADEKHHRSSSKRKSSSSSSKKKSTSSRSSSSSKHKKSSHSHSSSSSSKKSSKKKHKKKSSSSSSRHHKSSSSSRNRHQEDYAKLLGVYQGRKRDRLAIEESRQNGAHLCPVALDGPSGWRVACSSVESLRQLTLTLVDGSLEQERLRGRLISILKVQEKLEEERLKKQETIWQILPRRQSSRIAIGRIKTQTTSGEDESEDEDETHSRSRRSARSASSNGGIGYDSHQRLALERESRARRRQKIQYSDDESDEDMEGAPPSVKGWVDWSQLPTGNGRIVIVCRALVDRLLKEEIAELFARPVDPEEDGCPDYLTIIEHPIDLGTIRQRLDTGFYESWDLFALDVERVWSNCRRYNAPDMVVVQYANELEKMFRTMQKEAERKGMRRVKPQRDLTDDMDDDDGDDEDMDKSSDKESDANKAWSNSESSASDESSDDSEDDASGSDDEGRNKRRSAKPAPSSQTRPARSTRQVSSASSSSRTDRNRNRTRRRNTHSDSESSEGSAQSESEEESEDGARKSKRPARSRAAALRAQAQPVVPPPPVQTESKKPVRRNRIDSSDSSSSENESSSDESEADFSASLNSSKNEDAPAPPPSSPPPPPPPPPSTDETAKPAGSSSTPRKPLSSKRSAPLSPSRSPLSSSSSYFSSSSDSDLSDHSSDSN